MKLIEKDFPFWHRRMSVVLWPPGVLVFICATNDSRFRALDIDTGKERWSKPSSPALKGSSTSSLRRTGIACSHCGKFGRIKPANSGCPGTAGFT
jgi:hypothetical protein